MNYEIAERNTLRGAPAWVHVFSWGTCGVFTLALVVLYLLYRDTDVWLVLSGNPLPENHPFNEAIYGSIYRQRANTLSCLGYVLVGLYVIAYAWWDFRRPTSLADPYAVRQPALMGIFGITCIELGVGSGLMHAALTSWGHKLDVLGMVSTLATLTALHWARWVPGVRVGGRYWPTWPVFGFLAVAGSIYFVLNLSRFGFGNAGYAGIIGIVSVGIGMEFIFGKTSLQYRWPLLSLASLALAFYAWNLDKAGRFSSPDSWFQGHALWHLLTAVTLGSVAVFYRSEAPIRPEA